MPQSQIYLCDVPLENDYKNTFTFANATAQLSYFQSKIGKSYTDYNYLRKNNTIVVHGQVDNLRQYNYLFYQNTNFSNKWFYCFITSHEYVSDDSTRLYIETDVMQTWYFEIQYNQTFVEREHVTDDSVGANTIPENVELGEYLNSDVKFSEVLGTFPKIVMASTIDPNNKNTKLGRYYNGVYSGVRYYVWDNSQTEDLTDTIQLLYDDNRQDAIHSLFLAPSWLTPTGSSDPSSDTGQEVLASSDPLGFNFSMSRISQLGGNYTPKNKKLLTYPYCYFMLDNNNGGTAIYHQELFATAPGEEANINFNVYGALTPGCSIICVPFRYKNSNNVPNYSEALVGGKYPQINWAGDMYVNWLTQNGVNYFTSNINNAVSGGTSVATGNISGTISSLTQVANSIREVQLAQKVPPHASGNINCGDVVTGARKNGFTLYKKVIRREYARVIDNYFSMYGYKVNTLKAPNIHTRQNWNYIKTISCNFSGNIPQDDMIIIKRIFDNGITFWHNPNNIFNYSLNNDII